MDKVIKYGDFFIDPYNKRKTRKMRAEIREIRVKEYIKRADKGLPLFEEIEDEQTTLCKMWYADYRGCSRRCDS